MDLVADFGLWDIVRDDDGEYLVRYFGSVWARFGDPVEAHQYAEARCDLTDAGRDALADA